MRDSANSKEKSLRSKSTISRKNHATLADNAETSWGHRRNDSADYNIVRVDNADSGKRSSRNTSTISRKKPATLANNAGTPWERRDDGSADCNIVREEDADSGGNCFEANPTSRKKTSDSHSAETSTTAADNGRPQLPKARRQVGSQSWGRPRRLLDPLPPMSDSAGQRACWPV